MEVGYYEKSMLDFSFTSYQDNVTPLHVASQEGHHDVVQILLKAGAEVNAATFDVSDAMIH